MLKLLVEEVFVFTVKFNVAKLSQPWLLFNPVLVLEPAAVNVKPFQLYGNALGQILKLVVEDVVVLIVKFKVALLSQPYLLIKPVFV